MILRKPLLAVALLLASLILSPQHAANYTWQVGYTVVPLIQDVEPVSPVAMSAGEHGWIDVTEAYKLVILKAETNVYFKLMDADALIEHFTTLVVQIRIFVDADPEAVVTLPLMLPEEIYKYATLMEGSYVVDVQVNYVTEALTEPDSGAITVAIWAVEQPLSHELGAYYTWSVDYNISPS